MGDQEISNTAFVDKIVILCERNDGSKYTHWKYGEQSDTMSSK